MKLKHGIKLTILSIFLFQCGRLPPDIQDHPTNHTTDIASFTFINIVEAANVGFQEKEITEPEGSKRTVPALSLYNKIPAGIQVFDDGYIPFKIINPDIYAKVAILINKSPVSEDVPYRSKIIPVNDFFAELYFLQTVMGIEDSVDEASLVNYRIRYEDGEEYVFNCKLGNQVGDCWETPRRLTGAIRTFKDGHFWLVNTPWKNPYPDKKITWIQMESTGKATVLLFAISGSNDKDRYDSLITKINHRIQEHKNSNLKIALVQPFAEPDTDVNLEKGEKFCRKAKSMGADIAVFPEMYSVGYASIDFDKPNAMEECAKVALEQNGPFVSHFKDLARELDMAILITYLENRNGRFRNSATLIDRHGYAIMTYSKVHTLDFFKMEASFEPGEGFDVVELDTRFGPVKTGIMICYDREFPESARVLMLKGAELILTPNACGLDPLRINQFQTRAWENAIVCAMANYAEGQWYNGRSCAFHANGDELLMAEEGEGVFMVEVNMVEAREIREDTYWGNAFRRPHKYENLISSDVEEPFKRENVFGEPFEREER
jgi:predicted amidohydrolase